MGTFVVLSFKSIRKKVMAFQRFGFVCSVCLVVTQAAKLASGLAAPGADELAPLTQFRSQHRRTLDGRLCAAAFVQSGSAYTGCTDTPNPDGASGQPWCYVEPQLLGGEASTSWGPCAPIIDYDTMRQEAGKAIQGKVQEVRGYVGRLPKAEAAAKDTLKMFHARCG